MHIHISASIDIHIFIYLYTYVPNNAPNIFVREMYKNSIDLGAMQSSKSEASVLTQKAQAAASEASASTPIFAEAVKNSPTSTNALGTVYVL